MAFNENIKKYKHLIISLIVFISGILILWLFIPRFYETIYIPQETPKIEEKAEVGSKAPDFILKDLNNNEVSLLSLEGEPIYIVFWATWHPVAQDQIPTLEEFLKSSEKRNVSFYTIASGQKKEEVSSYIKRGYYNLPALVDNDNIVAEKYRVNSLPVHFFIDENLKIKEKYVGSLTLDQIKEKILKLQK